MATIYSVNLGAAEHTDTGVVHDLYTVPAAGGPAIIKSIDILCPAGGIIVVGANMPTGTSPRIGWFDRTGLSGFDVRAIDLYQPFAPTSDFFALNIGTSGYWTVCIGGYQFNQP